MDPNDEANTFDFGFGAPGATVAAERETLVDLMREVLTEAAVDDLLQQHNRALAAAAPPPMPQEESNPGDGHPDVAGDEDVEGHTSNVNNADVNNNDCEEIATGARLRQHDDKEDYKGTITIESSEDDVIDFFTGWGFEDAIKKNARAGSVLVRMTDTELNKFLDDLKITFPPVRRAIIGYIVYDPNSSCEDLEEKSEEEKVNDDDVDGSSETKRQAETDLVEVDEEMEDDDDDGLPPSPAPITRSSHSSANGTMFHASSDRGGADVEDRKKPPASTTTTPASTNETPLRPAASVNTEGDKFLENLAAVNDAIKANNKAAKKGFAARDKEWEAVEKQLAFYSRPDEVLRSRGNYTSSTIPPPRNESTAARRPSDRLGAKKRYVYDRPSALFGKRIEIPTEKENAVSLRPRPKTKEIGDDTVQPKPSSSHGLDASGLRLDNSTAARKRGRADDINAATTAGSTTKRPKCNLLETDSWFRTLSTDPAAKATNVKAVPAPSDDDKENISGRKARDILTKFVEASKNRVPLDMTAFEDQKDTSDEEAEKEGDDELQNSNQKQETGKRSSNKKKTGTKTVAKPKLSKTQSKAATTNKKHDDGGNLVVEDNASEGNGDQLQEQLLPVEDDAAMDSSKAPERENTWYKGLLKDCIAKKPEQREAFWDEKKKFLKEKGNITKTQFDIMWRAIREPPTYSVIDDASACAALTGTQLFCINQFVKACRSSLASY